MEYSLEAYKEAFRRIGFEECSDGSFEDGYEKIALFVNRAGTPTHAARQIDEGKWSSKLGKSFDIAHELRALTGSEYGSIAVFMKRPKEGE